MTDRRRVVFLTSFTLLSVLIMGVLAFYLSIDKTATRSVQAASVGELITVPPTTIESTTTLPPPTTTTSTTVALTTTTVARTTTTHTHPPTTTTVPRTTTTASAAAIVVTTTVVESPTPVKVSSVAPICNYILIDISAQTLSADCTDEDYTMPISSGSEVPYCENGSCGDAVTYRGTFKVHRMDPGYEEAPLGTIYNGIYFNGGIAIHGGHLPGYPASHGCVRVRYLDADWLFERARVGITVVKVQD